MTTKPATSAIRKAGNLTDQDYKKFCELVYKQVGIKLTEAKKSMVEARLHKRMRSLNMGTYRQYMHFLFSSEGMESELINLIDAVTTNTTHFFRENQHFEYLKKNILPQWLAKNGLYRRMNFWSAGCSTGMEPYTIAIVLNEFAKANKGFEFSILGTDISTKVLKEAMNAVYPLDRISSVPQPLKERYMLRGKGRQAGKVRLSKEIRDQVEFRRLNFMEEFSFKTPFDIIFCRNVVIYFDRSTQERLFNKLARSLKPKGNLLIGHSESMAGMNVPLRLVAPTIYERV